MKQSRRTPLGQDEVRGVAALLVPDILILLDEAPDTIAAETEEVHPADLADVAEALPRERVAQLLSALPAERAADVLEYLNEDLRSEVLEAMTTRQAAELVQLFAQTVQFAHQAGLLHRDLDPSNVRLDPFGQPRVTDLGRA